MAFFKPQRPPIQVEDTSTWVWKKWFNDLWRWSDGGVLVPSAPLNNTEAPTVLPLYPQRRNLLMNGAFQVWQRGSSISNSGSGTDYACDRWAINRVNAGTQVVSRQSGPPGFLYCVRVARSAADTGTSSLFLVQAIESAMAYQMAGQPVTLSFWMRVGSGWDSSVDYVEAKFDMGTGTDEGPFAAHTGAANVITMQIPNPTQGGPWKFYQATAICPSTCTEGKVYIDWTPSSSAAANNYIELAGVQLEIGPRATAFAMPNFADELMLCCRYYQKTFDYDTAPAQNAGAAGAHYYTPIIAGATAWNGPYASLRPKMRIAPTVTFYNPSATNAFARNFSRSTNATATAASGTGQNGFGISTTGIAGWALGDLVGVHYTADAEL